MSITLSDIFRNKRRNGYKTGGLVPYGFNVDEAGKLSKNPDEQKAIALMHEWRGNGFTLRAIAAELKKRGITTRKGRTTWQISVISDILKRGEKKPAYKQKITRKKQRAMMLLGDQCRICGYKDESGISMDFHHVDESMKTNSRGGLMGTMGMQFEKELRNCILLCSNCHRRLHAGIIEINNKEVPMESETKEVATKERITYGDVHICLSCEHHGTCRFAENVEGINNRTGRGAGYIVEIPEEWPGHGELETSKGQIFPDHPSEDKAILAGVRMCPRHSSGDPRLTEGVIE